MAKSRMNRKSRRASRRMNRKSRKSSRMNRKTRRAHTGGFWRMTKPGTMQATAQVAGPKAADSSSSGQQQ